MKGYFFNKRQDRFYGNKTNIYYPNNWTDPIRFDDANSTFNSTDIFRPDVDIAKAYTDSLRGIPINSISVNCEKMSDGRYLIKSDDFYLTGYKEPSHLEILAGKPIKKGENLKIGFAYSKKTKCGERRNFAIELLLFCQNSE